jgi:hypothetical protein
MAQTENTATVQQGKSFTRHQKQVIRKPGLQNELFNP